MAQIESIQVNINTGDESGAGTDGSIYVGVGGREFHLDTSADDFERGSSHKYVLGAGGDVVNPAVNDPRKHSCRSRTSRRFHSTCASSRTTTETTGTWRGQT